MNTFNVNELFYNLLDMNMYLIYEKNDSDVANYMRLKRSMFKDLAFYIKEQEQIVNDAMKSIEIKDKIIDIQQELINCYKALNAEGVKSDESTLTAK